MERLDGPTHCRAQALRQLEPLVGEWTFEPKWPSGKPWPSGGKVTFEWHDSRAHLIQRGTVERPDAPDNISIIGCDAANGTYVQLYSGVYEMSIDNRAGRLWREGNLATRR